VTSYVSLPKPIKKEAWDLLVSLRRFWHEGTQWNFPQVTADKEFNLFFENITSISHARSDYSAA